MEAVPAQSAVPAVAVIAADEILQRRAIAALRRDALTISGEADASVLVVACEDGWRSLLDRAAALRERHGDANIIAVATEFHVRELPRLLETGIRGVVLENELEATVGAAVRAVLSGQFVFPTTPTAPAETVLSKREKQVLAMVVLGCTNAEIATTLHVAETTVKSHLTSIFRKLGVRSRSQAAARVLDPRSGLGLGVVSLADEDSALHLTIDGSDLG